RFATRWQVQERGACLAFKVQHSEDAPMHARRAGCLERARLEFAAIIDRLSEVDRARISVSGLIAESLPDLEVCTRAAGAQVDDAADRVRRAKLTRFVSEMAQAGSLAHAGRYDDAAKRTSGLAGLARELGYRRGEAQLGELAGEIAEARDKFDDA